MSETEKLLQEIEAFLVKTEMPATIFGVRAVGNIAFVHKLRKGKTVLFETAGKARKFMREYKPDRVKKTMAETAA